MQKYFIRKGLVFPLLALLCLMLVVGGWLGATRTVACAVYLDGKQVCIVQDKAQVRQEVQKICQAGEQVTGHPIRAKGLKYRTVLAKKGTVLSASRIPDVLANQLHLKTTGAAIVVNGQTVVTVGSEKVAQDVLARLKEKHATCQPGEKLVSVAFQEKVEILSQEVLISKIVAPQKALSILERGTDTPVTYEVKEGDSLWLIARRHNLHVVDIKSANQLQSEKLKLGQKLLLYTTEPNLNVLATVEGSRTEKIPYRTKTVVDQSQSSVKVKQEGKEGEKRIAYQAIRKNGTTLENKTIAENIIKEAVDRVVVKGAKVVVASRGSRGSGVWNWPIYGQITSYYGSRGGSHKGLDINGNTGDPIRTVDSGRVIFAGRNGGYGLVVDIRHGSGVVTRYAHCSKLLVSVGEQVNKGQVIARVGSTGRSTGSHLHFEVISGGSQRNPLGYLR